MAQPPTIPDITGVNITVMTLRHKALSGWEAEYSVARRPPNYGLMTEWPVVGRESIFDRVAPSSYNNTGASSGRSLPVIGAFKRPRARGHGAK